MPTTAQERARHASIRASEAARTRRFDRYADEIADRPEGLGILAQRRLAEALSDCGWEIHIP